MRIRARKRLITVRRRAERIELFRRKLSPEDEAWMNMPAVGREFGSPEFDMEAQALRTAADHAGALKEIDALMSAESGTEEGERLSHLSKLIQEYEAQHYPMNIAKAPFVKGRE